MLLIVTIGRRHLNAVDPPTEWYLVAETDEQSCATSPYSVSMGTTPQGGSGSAIRPGASRVLPAGT